jgi:hypothetical protein
MLGRRHALLTVCPPEALFPNDGPPLRNRNRNGRHSCLDQAFSDELPHAIKLVGAQQRQRKQKSDRDSHSSGSVNRHGFARLPLAAREIRHLDRLAAARHGLH